MATRPAKRQRRSTVISSDDEDSNKTSGLPVRTQTKDTRLNSSGTPTATHRALRGNNPTSVPTSRVSSAKSSPTTSPQKTRKSNKIIVEAQPNKSLHNFFGKATDEQRWHRRADTPQQESQEDVLVDDIVDDDDSLDEDFARLAQDYTGKSTTASFSKSFTGQLDGSRSSTPTASQRFAKSAIASRSSDQAVSRADIQVLQDQKPWADRFAPLNLDELAVHKKKIADVQKWLEDVQTARSPQKILVLRGPAGSGKSTTVQLLAQSLGMQITAWHNPTVSDAGHASTIQQFGDFLDRGGQFEALTLNSNASISAKTTSADRQLLMVEEYPTSMSRSSNVLDTFRSTILQHIMRTTKTVQPNSRQSLINNHQPVVLIISETLLTSSTALSDSFTAHRLLGPEILNHPLVFVIDFNPVAPTFIAKAIDIVVKKEARESGRRRMPGPAVLQQLAEVGDVRSAINSLEFLCARGDDSISWSGTVATGSKKVSKGRVPLTEAEQNALQLISKRESTLDMFHAAGKVVYNKREDPRVLDSRAEPPPKPPDHLMHLYTPKVSQVDVDMLLNETGTDIQTFISTVHENYVLSCNGDGFVDTFESCAQFLSDSDYLNPESRSLIRAKGSSKPFSGNVQSGNSEMLRQDEISFQVASRGLLFGLPFPVNRAIPQGMRKQDAFKMFYPASLRLWKPAEEIHDLVSFFAGALRQEDAHMSTATRNTSGVASWKSRSLNLGNISSFEDATDVNGPRATSFLSRHNLVTELLPYLTKIRAAQHGNVEVLRKITQLRGLYITGDEVLEEEQYNEGTDQASARTKLQQRVEEAHSILQAQKMQAARSSLASSTKLGQGGASRDTVNQEKLYISDDDIQDD